jgi:hypothetical protein
MHPSQYGSSDIATFVLNSRLSSSVANSILFQLICNKMQEHFHLCSNTDVNLNVYLFRLNTSLITIYSN